MTVNESEKRKVPNNKTIRIFRGGILIKDDVRQINIRHRVDTNSGYMDLIMKMGRDRSSCGTDPGDCLTAFHYISFLHHDTAAMCISCFKTETVVNLYGQTISLTPAGI